MIRILLTTMYEVKYLIELRELMSLKLFLLFDFEFCVGVKKKLCDTKIREKRKKIKERNLIMLLIQNVADFQLALVWKVLHFFCNWIPLRHSF